MSSLPSSARYMISGLVLGGAISSLVWGGVTCLKSERAQSQSPRVITRYVRPSAEEQQELIEQAAQRAAAIAVERALQERQQPASAPRELPKTAPKFEVLAAMNALRPLLDGCREDHNPGDYQEVLWVSFTISASGSFERSTLRANSALAARGHDELIACTLKVINTGQAVAAREQLTISRYPVAISQREWKKK